MIPVVRNRVPGYSGMRDRLLFVRQSILSHVHVAGVDDCTVMGDTVYDCLRNDVSAQTNVPLALLVLRAEDIVRPLNNEIMCRFTI